MKSPLSLLILLNLLLAVSLAQAAPPTAELDRDRIAEGESVILSLTVPGDLDGDPDFSPLQRDFDILGQSQSSHTSIINGRMDSKRVWRLTLAPRGKGRLTLPPIPVGDQQTRAQSLTVTEAGNAEDGGQAPQAFIEVAADPDSPYVQGQVVYRVKVFFRVNLRDAALNDPNVDGVPVERLGKDLSDKEYRHGHRYNVIERRYALFPQHSGELEIQPPLLSANVPVQGRRSRTGLASRIFGHDPFGDMDSFFQESRPLRVRGKPLTLQVRPQPTQTNGAWLPARELSLEEDWSPRDGFRAGEPITRSITLRALGLTDAQLPELPTPSVDGLKVYADRPQGETRPLDGGLEATRQYKVALVPTREGSFELPEIRVEWWDTQADEPRIARLPGRTIQVAPAPVIAEPASPSAQAKPAQQPAQAEVDKPGHAPPALLPATLNQAVHPNYWPWIAAALGLLWLLTLALWWFERRRRGSTAGVDARPKERPAKPDASAVKQACRANEPAQARQALLAWGRASWPDSPPTGLAELARRLGDDAARDTLSELDAVLYASEAPTWNGDEAWKRLKPALKTPKNGTGRTRTQALPALYPASRTT